MNRLALDLDVATSQAGKRLAALYKAGKWPTLTVVLQPTPLATAPPSPLASKPTPALPAASPPKSPPRPDPGLKLKGIAYGNTPLAIINGRSLAEGQTITLPLKQKPVTLKCVKIETNSVVVTLDDEETPRRLFLK